MNTHDLTKLSRYSMWGKITVRDLSNAEAAKVVAWWQLGLPAVQFEAFSLDDDDGHFLPEKTVYGTDLLNDGQYSVWSAAGFVSYKERTPVRGLTWCKEYLDRTVRTLSCCTKDTFWKFYNESNFDQVLYTGLEMLGKADYTRCVVDNLFKALPLTSDELDTILWVGRAYYWLAFKIVEANRDKVRKVALLFHENGCLSRSAVEELFKSWGKPKNLGLTLEAVEKELGPCPVKGIDRDSFDLLNYSVRDFPGYGPIHKD